jgi:hypothetical protein
MKSKFTMDVSGNEGFVTFDFLRGLRVVRLVFDAQ